MKINWTVATMLGIIVGSFVLALVMYPHMPEEMASSWSFAGEVNDYLPKFWGLFLMPLISVGVFALYLLIPRIDPLRQNIGEFRGYFDRFILLTLAFLFYVYLLTLLWNLGYRFSFARLFSPAFALLFYYAGIMMSRAKRNWFIGIKTPWTLSSETTWVKTHELGGKLFRAAGLIAVMGLFLPEHAIYVVLAPVIGISLYLVVYSYLVFQKEDRRK